MVNIMRDAQRTGSSRSRWFVGAGTLGTPFGHCVMPVRVLKAKKHCDLATSTGVIGEARGV